MSINEKEAREKMTYFKRELENRETNFNERFFSGEARGQFGETVSSGPLRVLQQDNAKSGTKASRQGSTTRRKVPKKKTTGSGRKKKSASSQKLQLPKIAK